MISILQLARPEILTLRPYEHAAWEPAFERMHANEMPWRASQEDSAAGLNRYPEPQPEELIEHLAQLYGTSPENVLAGRGSDEGIDLLVRAFCRAGEDSIMICPPTFGMYKVSARIQGAGVVEVPLLKERGFALDAERVLAAWNDKIKLIFLCSPNNPTGNLLDRAAIEALCTKLTDKAVVVVDEAYIEFAGVESIVPALARFENLVVLRTLSKAYALAGARCGALLAHKDIVALLSGVITPYALPTHTIESVLLCTDASHRAEAQARIQTILREREVLLNALVAVPAVRRVWRSDANFLLLQCVDVKSVLDAAMSGGLIIRDLRSNPLLADCVRVSVGTPEQNARLVRALERLPAAVSGDAA
jgi:histidinol-phosphate aminotransferase